MSEIIWYLSFSAGLISLSIMHSSSIHVIANVKISFFLMPEYYVIYILFIHSSTNGHLGSFRSLAITFVCLFLKVYLFILRWRERASMGEGQRERGRENPKLSVWSPIQGSVSLTVTSCPTKSWTLNHLSHPGTSWLLLIMLV